MENQNGSTNGTAEKVKLPTCLDGAKERFKARKSPASEKDVASLLKKYFELDAKYEAAQKALAEVQAERTSYTVQLAELRGTSTMNVGGRGAIRFMARGDSAWLLEPGKTDGPVIKL